MRISLLFLFAISITFSTLAQSDSISTHQRNRFIYFNNFLAGGLFGKSEQGSGVTLSMMHGVRLNRLTLGAGIEFDSYTYWRAVPFFAGIGFDFAKIKNNAFFLQINAGYADASRTTTNDWWIQYNDYGGRMIGSSIGYRISTEKFSLYLLAGHKFQEAHYSYNPTPWSSGPQSSLSVTEEMNRFTFQIGFGLH